MESDDLQSTRPGRPASGSADSATAVLFAGFRVGQGRYVLERELGRGGMGVVWLALDTELEDHLALKFLPSEIRRDATALDDLKRETMKSRKLTHPNIIRIHDFCRFEGELPFISMEFVEGTTLSSLKVEQEARCFTWDAIQPWASQLCAALDYAHGEGVVHRDLKPSNIMLDARGRVKLADFGLAATISDSMGRVSMNMGNSGTPSYMSPQQMDGRPPKATDDIYALGATLYELLTSKPPFHSGDIPHQVRNLAPDPLEQRLADLGIESHVPGNVAALLLACLSKDAGRRPQSARAVAEFVGLEVSSNPVGTSALAAESSSRDMNALEEEPPSQAEVAYGGSAEAESSSGRSGMPRWIWGAVGAGTLVLVVVIGLVAMNWNRSGRATEPSGTTPVAAAPPGAKTAASPPAKPAPEPAPKAEVVKSSAASRQPAIPPAPSLPPPDETDEKLVATWRAKLNKAGIRGQLTAAGGGKLDLDLTQSPITTLSALAGMPLHTLKLNFCPNVTNLTPLRGMSLVIINLTNTKITDLSPLAGMPLGQFHMQNSLVRDFSPLKGMPLKVLDLGDSKYVNLSQFGELPMLAVLDLFRTPVKELSAFRDTPIWSLHLSESAVTDLGALPGMELQELELNGCRQLRDLSPLLQCSKLIHLSVPPNATNLTLLRNHPSLKRLTYARKDKWPDEPTPQEFWAAYDKRARK